MQSNVVSFIVTHQLLFYFVIVIMGYAVTRIIVKHIQEEYVKTWCVQAKRFGDKLLAFAVTVGGIIEELLFGYIPASFSIIALVAARLLWAMLHYYNVSDRRTGIMYAIATAIDGFTIYVPPYIMFGPFHGFIIAAMLHSVNNAVAYIIIRRECKKIRIDEEEELELSCFCLCRCS